ncbi:MAG TPA: DNA polymerase III subunit gamma/tau [Tepidisphaeraceae bacterium]|jgi:DNA polymerase-3 subunit gamma/tau
MAYTVLARRYRSGNFDELVGQGHVAQTLKNAITTNRLAHAFLFCGTRGTGKTSSARILAKCLNCEKFDAPTPTPCGTCNSCTAIARGDDIDVIEIDAASNTGVDNVREIIENAQFRPARSRFKVYIIDEVHMLSKSAFNALLKTLEEPPEHVKFILATTEAEKVLPTILSRCQRYDFRNIPTREIAGHLKNICAQEKIKADDAAILLVAKSGAGSMRDALSLLDRLLSAVGENLTVESIEQLLGLPRSGQIFDLAASIAAGDIKTTLERTDVLITSGLSPETLAGALIDHLRNLLILRTCGKNSDLVEVPGLSLDDLFAQATPFDPVVLSQDIVILEELRRQLRTSAAGRALVDATMVRLALAEQFSTVETLLHAVDDTPAGAGGAVKKKSEVSAGTNVAVRPAPMAAGVNPRENPDVAQDRPVLARVDTRGQNADATTVSDSSAATPPPEEDDTALPAVGRVWEGAGPTSVFAAFKKSNAARPAAAPAAPPAPAASRQPPAADGDSNLATLMTRLRHAASEQQPTIAGFLDGGRITALDGSTLTLEYPKHLEVSAKMLDRNGKRESLQNVLAGLLGHTVGVRFTVNQDDTAPPTPAQAAETQHATWKPPATPVTAPDAPQPPTANGIPITEELRVELLQQNPLIKMLADQFNARVVKVEES